MTILNNSLENKLYNRYIRQTKNNNYSGSMMLSGGLLGSESRIRPSLDNLKANFLAFRSQEIQVDLKVEHSADYIKEVDRRFQIAIGKAANFALESNSKEITGVHLLAVLIDDAVEYLNNPVNFSYKPALIKEIERIKPETLSSPMDKAIVAQTLSSALGILLQTKPLTMRENSTNELLLEEDFDKALASVLKELRSKSKIKIYPNDGAILEAIKKMPDNVLSKSTYNIVMGAFSGKSIDAKTAAGITPDVTIDNNIGIDDIGDRSPSDKLPHIKSYGKTAQFIGSLIANKENRILLINEKGSVPKLVINELAKQINENRFEEIKKDKTTLVSISAGELLKNPGMLESLESELSQNEGTRIIVAIKDFEHIVSDFMYSVADMEKSDKKEEMTVFDYICAPLSNNNLTIVGMLDAENYQDLMSSSVDGDSILQALKSDLKAFSSVLLPNIGRNESIDFIRKLISDNPTEFNNRFSGEAIKEAVDLAYHLKGSYPGKALNIINMMDSCFSPEKKKYISKKDVTDFVGQFRDFLYSPSFNLTDFSPVSKNKLRDYILPPKSLSQVSELIENINTSKTRKGVLANDPWSKIIVSGSSNKDREELVKTIATETKLPILTVKTPKMINYFYNNTEIPLTMIFKSLKMIAQDNPYKTAILHIEDLDALASFYSMELTDTHQKVGINKLFDEIEKLKKQGLNIIVVGSTDSSEQLNDEIYRSGGFKEEVLLPSAHFDKEYRDKIICNYIKQKRIHFAEDSIDLKAFLADISYGCEKEDIYNIIDRSQEIARINNRKEVNRSDIKEAFARTATGRMVDIKMTDRDKGLLVAHEVGHYLTNLVMYKIAEETEKTWGLPDQSSLIDINTRKDYLGATFFTNDGYKERSLDSIFADLVRGFGGEAGEDAVYKNQFSGGISSDLRMATSRSLLNIIYLGMGDSSGRISLDYNLLPEEEKQKIIDKAKIWNHNAQIASKIITYAYKDFLDKVVEKYSSKVGTGHIIDSEEFNKVFKEFLGENKNNPTFNSAIESLKQRIPQIISDTMNGRRCNTPKEEQRLSYEEALIRGKN